MMTSRRVGVMLCVAAMGVSGCHRGPQAGAARPRPRETAERALQELDADQNGTLSQEELQKSPGLMFVRERMDADADGQIDAAEIRAFFQAYRERKVTLMAVRCNVTFKGKPLSGATVTLVPESFLGDEIKKATGLTDESGGAQLVADGAKYPGVQMGIYRIQVSRLGPNGKEQVPARYNNETELACEVSPATAKELQQGLVIRLGAR